MITVRDGNLARTCDALRNHGAVPVSSDGRTTTGHDSLLPGYSLAGFNYRLTDIQAALGVAQMRRLEWLLHERRRCAEYYNSSLRALSWLRLPDSPDHQVHAWQSYVPLFAPQKPNLQNANQLHQQRNRLMRYLQDRGISTRQGTHAPAHLEYYRCKYGIRPEDFPNAFLADRLSLALPLFPGMTEAELDYVSKSIQSFDPIE
jgi:dTDP-4-amino-4,6-dideoxygalactose transaminase